MVFTGIKLRILEFYSIGNRLVSYVKLINVQGIYFWRCLYNYLKYKNKLIKREYIAYTFKINRL